MKFSIFEPFIHFFRFLIYFKNFTLKKCPFFKTPDLLRRVDVINVYNTAYITNLLTAWARANPP